jgi:hypothetical protein
MEETQGTSTPEEGAVLLTELFQSHHEAIGLYAGGVGFETRLEQLHFCTI